jgi:hypothetical protein
MSGINTGKVITGGLLAGVVFNAFDIVNGLYILGPEFQANATRLGLDPAAMNSAAGMATWIIIDFLLGFIVVWTYAAIRTRFGPGAKTAVYAALVPYLSITMIMYGLTQGGMMTSPLFWKMSCYSLVSTIVGTLVGARFYSEA